MLATWFGWRAAFFAPAAVLVATGIFYLWVTPDDRRHAKSRQSKPAVPLTPRLAVMLFGLFIVIALSAGLTFNVLTIALPKIVDEPPVRRSASGSCRWHCDRRSGLRRARATGPLAAWSNGFPRVIFAAVTGIGFLGNLWAAYSTGVALLIALAIAVAAIYGQVTVNDMIMARYTADAWRGRVYAVRYFLLFISAGAAIGMISILHESGGFALVLGVNAVIALLLFATTLALVAMIISVEGRRRTATRRITSGTAAGSDLRH